jgi:hypothetical protein
VHSIHRAVAVHKRNREILVLMYGNHTACGNRSDAFIA